MDKVGAKHVEISCPLYYVLVELWWSWTHVLLFLWLHYLYKYHKPRQHSPGVSRMVDIVLAADFQVSVTFLSMISSYFIPASLLQILEISSTNSFDAPYRRSLVGLVVLGMFKKL